MSEIDTRRSTCRECGHEAKNYLGLRIHESRIHGNQTTALAVPQDSVCQVCGHQAKNYMGRRMHEARMHDMKRPGGLALQPKRVHVLQADDLIGRMERATDVLFPERVTAHQIMLVAKWQHATLQMLAELA